MCVSVCVRRLPRCVFRHCRARVCVRVRVCVCISVCISFFLPSPSSRGIVAPRCYGCSPTCALAFPSRSVSCTTINGDHDSTSVPQRSVVLCFCTFVWLAVPCVGPYIILCHWLWRCWSVCVVGDLLFVLLLSLFLFVCHVYWVVCVVGASHHCCCATFLRVLSVSVICASPVIHLVGRSVDCFISWSFDHSICHSFVYSVCLIFGHSAVQSVDHLVSHSLSHSVMWAVAHTIK